MELSFCTSVTRRRHLDKGFQTQNQVGISERFLHLSFRSRTLVFVGCGGHAGMSGLIRISLICDSCGVVIAHGISANAVLLEAQPLYHRRGGKVLCLTCHALALRGSRSDEKRPLVNELYFTCPRTGRQTATGIGTDAESLRAAWKRMLKLDCPHCGESHEVSVRETYLNSALKDANDRTI
jgi:hypothetical protein